MNRPWLVIILGLLFFLGTFILLEWGIEFFFAPPLPDLSSSQAVLAEPVKRVTQAKVNLLKFKDCYAYEKEGIPACYLTGQPEVKGSAIGRFYTKQTVELERSLINSVVEQIPSDLFRWFLARYLIMRNHNLYRFIPEEIQYEIAGLVASTKDLYPRYGKQYTRFLNYLAAPDISHSLVNWPMIGCTAIGVNAEFTKNATPLLARNFDFEGGEAFNKYKLVMLIKPKKGQSFISIAWPGMFGVVSGMNDSGLGVVLLAGHSSISPHHGSPGSVLARKVLTQAETLEQAIEIIRKAKVFAFESFMLGSGVEDRFVIVEKTTHKTGIKEMSGGRILATDHFLTWAARYARTNQDYQREGASVLRLKRLQELVGAKKNEMDIASIVEILRDRQGLFGEELGLGNKIAINPLIASHGVVFDLRNKIAWVSQGPHQLGAFIPFAMSDFLGKSEYKKIPADVLLTSGKYKEYVKYKQEYTRAEKLFAKKKYRATLAKLLEIRSLNPKDYKSFILAGKSLEQLRRWDEAYYNFHMAKKMSPAFFIENIEIERKLQELERKKVKI